MIRPAVSTDAETLGALQLRCWHETYGELAPPGTLDTETLDRRVRVWRGLLERGMDILESRRGRCAGACASCAAGASWRERPGAFAVAMAAAEMPAILASWPGSEPSSPRSRLRLTTT